MSSFASKAKKELWALLPPTAFFIVALHLILLERKLMLAGTGIHIESSLTVTLGALVIAKAVLIADLLPPINRFPDRPLAYNIAWKSSIYVVVATVAHYVERLIDFWRQTGGLVSGNEKLLAETAWPQFWAVELLLVVLILSYTTLSELSRALGARTLRQLFFGPLPQGALSIDIARPRASDD